MTLDEIISNAEYCADVYEKMNKAIHPALQVSDYKRHAEDHRQLAEWLRELKAYREKEQDKSYEQVESEDKNDRYRTKKNKSNM